MPEIIQCPECRRQLRLPDELPDNLVRCPSCAHEFVVNRTEDGGVAITTTPSKPSPEAVPVLTPVDRDDEPREAEGRRRRRADDPDDRRRRRRGWPEEREARRFVSPPRRSWGWIIAIVAIVAVVGLSSIVTVVALASRRRSPRQAPPLRVANNAGGRVALELMPADDAELTRKMKELFDSLGQSYQINDLVGCVALFDVERMAEESLPLLNLPQRNPHDQLLYEQALRQGLMNDLAVRNNVLLWTTGSSDVRKVTRVNGDDVVVIARHKLASGVWIKLRWGVSRRTGQWKFHDMEDLVTGIHYPLLVAREAARGQRKVDQESAAIHTLSEVSEALAEKKPEVALEKLDSIKSVPLPTNLEPARYLMRCMALLARKKPNEALEAVDRALALQPDLPGGDWDKGVCYLQLSQWDKALPLVEGYHKLFGDESSICQGMGLALRGNRRFAEAAAMYRKSLDLNPKNADSFLGLFDSCDGPGPWNDLGPRFLRLDNLRGNYDICAADSEERQYPTLLEPLALAMQKADPKFAPPDHHLSLMRAREGKSNEAVVLFKSSLAKQPNPELRKTYATKFLEAMATAGKTAEAYAAATDQREAFRILATTASNRYQTEALTRLIAAHRKTNPDDPLLPLYQGVVYVRQGQYELAEKSFVAALLKPPDEATLSAHRANRVLARYHTGKALSAYRDIGPQDETFRQLAALAYDDENDALLQSLLDAHTMKDAESVDVTQFACRLRIRQNRIDEAVALFKSLAKKPIAEEEQSEIHEQLLADFAACGQALAAYRADPEADTAFQMLAGYLLNDGHHNDLPRLIEAHRAVHPADPWLAYYQGELHVREEAWDKAALAFAEAWKNASKENRLTFRWHHVLALYRLGQWAQAYEKLEPRNDTFAQLANLMLQDKKRADLEALCKAHQPHAADDPELLYYQSLALVLARKPAEAVVFLKKAMAKNKEEYRRQGYQRGFLLQIHEQGLTIEGYRLAPDREIAFSTLAPRLVTEKKEKELGALVTLHSAGRDVSPEDNFYLGEVFLLRGEIAKAESYFTQAVAKASPTNLWRYRNRLYAVRVKAKKALVTYQEIEHNSASFEQIAGLCVAEKDVAQLQALIEAHRKTNPDDSNLALRELDVLWLKNDYAGVVKALSEGGDATLRLPLYRWKTHDYLVRALVKLKRFDDASREADAHAKNRRENPVLLILAQAASGNVERTLAVLDRFKTQPWIVSNCYSDPDLGTILRSDAFRRVREKYPEPKGVAADNLDDDD